MTIVNSTENMQQISDSDLKPGDVLIFKIPPYKPSLSVRFNRFMQGARYDSRAYADAVHAAVVTEADQFGAITIAHYTNDGYEQLMLSDSYCKSFPYEVFRPNDPEMSAQIVAEAEKPESIAKKKYSFTKMIAAFLRKEGIVISDKVRQSKLFADLNNKANAEEICSSFAWRCVKAAGKSTQQNKYEGTSSYILPGTLMQRMVSDENFTRLANPKPEAAVETALIEIYRILKKELGRTQLNKFQIWQNKSGSHHAQTEKTVNAMLELIREHRKNPNPTLLKDGLAIILKCANLDKIQKTPAFQLLKKEAEKQNVNLMEAKPANKI